MKSNVFKITSIFIVSIIFSLGIINTAYAWSSEDDPMDETHSTHLFIVNRAIEILAADKNKEKYVDEIAEMKKQIAQGLFDADHKNPYYDNGTFASHFYDPDTKTNYLGLTKPTAKISGVKYFKQAADLYKENKKEQAFYTLGLALHYFTDITQPMHVGNFSNLDHRAVGYHSKFENYTDEIKDNAIKKGLKADYHFVVSDDPGVWLHQAAVFAKSKFNLIFNDNIQKLYARSATSNEAAKEWRDTIKPHIIEQLFAAESQTAGFINLWFDSINNPNEFWDWEMVEKE